MHRTPQMIRGRFTASEEAANGWYAERERNVSFTDVRQTGRFWNVSSTRTSWIFHSQTLAMC